MELGNSELSAFGPTASVFVGCSGWFYWKWRGLFYPADLPTGEWFKHYAKRLDTVEINASFYSWPTVANVKAWKRPAGKQSFVYTVKVCELIIHIKRFKGTKTLVKDFGISADVLGERMGCFLFQLPPSYRYTKARLTTILGQLDPARRNVVEFRHASWWSETVYAAFRATGTIFCSCSGPRLPDELVRTADDIYLRLHGPKRWNGTTIPGRNFVNGSIVSKPAAHKEHGTILTMTMKPMPPETHRPCGACSQVVSSRRIRSRGGTNISAPNHCRLCR
jgi:uncharacterized protein YecE (DUF72 family)